MMYDCIIVGAGFCGSVIARKLAEESNKKVLILEKRNHIAGNAYDEFNEYGILIQKYGPHIFHTNSDEVYAFITRYGAWKDYRLNCEVFMDGVYTPSPFNFKTIDTFYPEEYARKLKQNILEEYPNRDKATIVEMLESKNPIVKQYANMLFEKDYSLYTAKQWGIEPSKIDISVLKRVPVRFNYEDRYFDDKYECFPKKGYTNFFENLLNHENITVKTNIDALKEIQIDDKKGKVYINSIETKVPVVFTGAIDELLAYKYGKLPYRSLYFKYETKDLDSFQNAPVVAYPQVPDYTRVTEYTKLPHQDGHGKTTIAYEYPLQYKYDSDLEIEPYYPIINDSNFNLYSEYLNHLKDIKSLFLCGRLADYKYYNMDNAIERAFLVYQSIIKYISD
ncbi:UDP-galactopyranose mutase [Anaerocolumna sp. AGMB13025]|uniref:UDP-galactopyranose mutase n=1 Tax=Anaerocolumna sp. AGMB13025 TaxID=3039116 RepID=UPI00241CF425|nr:UDP-galactopyranose mutase [Anaerocolumna sp. AGMB13025]WFR56311.1 UDP-galactopyranose mutase [Anaerocolumna sp. AGMB13025]